MPRLAAPTRLACLAVAVALAGGCGSSGEPPPSFGPHLSEIQAAVFTPSCTFSSCHGVTGPEQGMSLVAPVRAAIVGHAAMEAPGLRRIEPGDPDGSYLLQKLEQARPAAGMRMPPQQPLSPGAIAVIREWIAAGAADD